ncbi:MAG: hypothetical protein LBU28_04380 [Spirochaetaceae bacterium]|jgi:hypothetical protein|nr:hypothetical protein [Spirochaetaceae bacterium]
MKNKEEEIKNYPVFLSFIFKKERFFLFSFAIMDAYPAFLTVDSKKNVRSGTWELTLAGRPVSSPKRTKLSTEFCFLRIFWIKPDRSVTISQISRNLCILSVLY